MQNKILENLYKSLGVLVIILSVVGIIYAVNLYKEGKLIGSGAIISVTGTGKVSAKPDISNITFTIREQSKSNKEGQDKIAIKMTKAMEAIKKLVEEKDIKTNTYSSYPRYSYPANSTAKIDGYDVSQSVTIKVRNIDNVPKVLDIISASGINEVTGPDYTIDDADIYKSEARKLAIDEAKAKAEKLADQLGVSIVRVLTFSEDQGYVAIPHMTMRAEKVTMGMDAVVAPTLPTGENEIISNVTITFEIK